MRAFGRFVELTFIKVQGDNSNKNNALQVNSNEAYFTVMVEKFFSHLKDECVITIYNLNKHEVMRLVNEGYNYVNIKFGYKNSDNESQLGLLGPIKILTITSDQSDLITTKTVVVCSAKFSMGSESPIKFNRGNSLFNVLSFLSRKLQLNSKIDVQLKNLVLQQEFSVKTFDDALRRVLKDNPQVSVSNELGDQGYDIIFERVYNSKKKIIEISPESGTLINSHIQIQKDGSIEFTSLPVYRYQIGDLLSINFDDINRYVDNVSSFKEYKSTTRKIDEILEKEKWLKESNHATYVISSLKYELDVRGNFSVNIRARPEAFYNRERINRGI